jgi:hypothetical protein
MYQLQPVREREQATNHALTCHEGISMAERELREFIGFATNFLGSEPTKFLTDIWLDELASMETMPGPTCPDWRLVTVAATARLATRLLSRGYCKRSAENWNVSQV